MPGIEQTENQIRYRVRDPKLFQEGSFRTKKLPAKGVSIIVGRLKKPPKGQKGSAVVQSYRFDKKAGWTVAKARAWLKKEKVMASHEPLPENYHSYLQGIFQDDHDWESELEKVDFQEVVEEEDTEDTGKVMISGETAEARGLKSKLHDHPFELVVSIDDAGELVFEGKAVESDSADHTHEIDTVASSNDQLEYQIETEEASNGHHHRHLIDIVLEEPLSLPDDEINEDSETVEEDVQQNEAPTVFAKKNLWKESGIVFFKDEEDPQRDFANSTFAFCSPLNLAEAHKNGNVVVKNNKKYLRHEILRTGDFAHPWHGIVEINEKKITALKENFDKGILGQRIAFNISHRPELGALGWHDELSIEPKRFKVVNSDGTESAHAGFSLYSLTELTPFGEQELLELEKFAYTSAEIMWKMEDVEQFESDEEEEIEDENGEVEKRKKKYHNVFNNVLVGSAATNIPFIPRLAAFAASMDDAKEVYENLIHKYGNTIQGYERARAVVINELRKRGRYV